MKILSSGDWHINLNRKKVPYKWQENRFLMLFEKLRNLEKECDVHVISGDVFDKAPNTDETCLVLSYLNSVQIPTILIPGNHSSTKKGHSFWEHFKRDGSITNNNIYLSTENEYINIKGQGFQTFPYGSVEVDKLPEYRENSILVTHIRGEVPPHITAEYDFEKLRPWKLILLSDLHFNHKYKDYPAYYPGSPMNTTFDRTNTKLYGVDIIELNSVDDYTVTFIDLELPRLIRKTIKAGEELLSGDYDHVVYEITGSIDDLAKIEKNELLDKKMVEKPTSSSSLNLANKKQREELFMYLKHIKIKDIEPVMDTYDTLGIKE